MTKCLGKDGIERFHIAFPLPSNDLPNTAIQVYNIQVYSRTLSPVDLDTLNKEGVNGTPMEQGLIAGWLGPSGQQLSSVLVDKSGNGNDAVIVGGRSWVADIP